MSQATQNAIGLQAEMTIAQAKWIGLDMPQNAISVLTPIYGESLARSILLAAFAAGYTDGVSAVLKRIGA